MNFHWQIWIWLVPAFAAALALCIRRPRRPFDSKGIWAIACAVVGSTSLLLTALVLGMTAGYEPSKLAAIPAFFSALLLINLVGKAFGPAPLPESGASSHDAQRDGQEKRLGRDSNGAKATAPEKARSRNTDPGRAEQANPDPGMTHLGLEALDEGLPHTDDGEDSGVRSPSLLVSALAQVPEALAIANTQGQLVFVNRAWAELHDLRPSDAEGQRWSVFHTPDQVAGELGTLLQEASRHGEAEGILHRRRRNGSTFASRTRFLRLHDPESREAVGWIASILAEDIPAAGTAVNLSGVGGSSPSATDKAAELGLFARKAAHDVNNLLSAIVGSAGLALDKLPEDSPLRSELEDVESIAMQASAVAVSLQEMARAVVPPEAEPRPTDRRP